MNELELFVTLPTDYTFDQGTLLQINTEQKKSIVIDQRLNFAALKEKISNEFQTRKYPGNTPYLYYK
jgi:hypothetical protein